MAIKYPCGICNKNVKKESIECAICNQKIHIKCSKLSKKEYDSYKNNTKHFYCITCMAENIPFTNLTDTEISAYLKGINILLNSSHEFNPSQQRLFDKLNNFINQNSHNSNMSDNNDDEEVSINCKYYSIDEFTRSKFKAPKSFSILHLNVHSII